MGIIHVPSQILRDLHYKIQKFTSTKIIHNQFNDDGKFNNKMK